MKKLSLKSIAVFIVILIIHAGCNNALQQKETVNTKDSLQQKKERVTPKDTGKSENINYYSRFFPLQKLSLKEIENFLEGTWAPINDDTVPYNRDTYTNGKRITTYPKNPGYKTLTDSYSLSVECPPDSILYWGFDRSEKFPCLCYMLLIVNNTPKNIGCMAILKITKDSLYITDGEDNLGYVSYAKVKSAEK